MTHRRISLLWPLAAGFMALAACDAAPPDDAAPMPPREQDAPPADDLDLQQAGDAPVETVNEEGEEGADSAPEPETRPADDQPPPEEPPTG